MAEKKKKRRVIKHRSVNKLSNDGVMANPAIEDPDSETDGSADVEEVCGDEEEGEDEIGTLEGYEPEKIVYECPFCSHPQEDSCSADPTTCWCQQCGRAFPSNCIQKP